VTGYIVTDSPAAGAGAGIRANSPVRAPVRSPRGRRPGRGRSAVGTACW